MTSEPWRWRSLLEPSRHVQDPEERRRARLLMTLLLALIGISAVSSIFVPLATRTPGGPITEGGARVGFAAAVLLAGAYFVARSRRPELGALLVIGVATAAAWGAYLVENERPESSLYLAFLAVSVILSGMLLRPMLTVWLGVLQVASILVLPPLLPTATFDLVVPALIFVVIVTTLVAVSGFLRERDAVERRAAQQALVTSEERYRNLVEGSPDGILIHAEGKVVYSNQAGAALFASGTPQALLGRPILSLAAPEYRETIAGRIKSIEEGTTTTPLEVEILRDDGARVTVEVMGAPTMHDGHPADQSIVRDVTLRKEAEARLSEIQRLEEINELKTHLLNTAGHELNTPIAALKLQLHLLKQGPEETDERRGKALRLIERNVQRLGTLVKDVLDVARMQNGHLRIRRERGDLVTLAHETVEFYEEPARAAGVELALVSDGPVEAEVDRDRLAQVLHNLLSNALKFTAEGGRVEVRAGVQGGEGVVRVRDTGSGLDADQMARLFQPFSQVHDAARISAGGTGLGLYICKGILEQHGGRIWVESDGPGKGSTFAFSVPLAATDALEAPA